MRPAVAGSCGSRSVQLICTVYIGCRGWPRSRSVAQRLEHRSPKPGVGGSNPSTPASYLLEFPTIGIQCCLCRMALCYPFATISAKVRPLNVLPRANGSWEKPERNPASGVPGSSDWMEKSPITMVSLVGACSVSRRMRGARLQDRRSHFRAPRPIGMVLTDPTRALASPADHWSY